MQLVIIQTPFILNILFLVCEREFGNNKTIFVIGSNMYVNLVGILRFRPSFTSTYLEEKITYFV